MAHFPDGSEHREEQQNRRDAEDAESTQRVKLLRRKNRLSSKNLKPRVKCTQAPLNSLRNLSVLGVSAVLRVRSLASTKESGDLRQRVHFSVIDLFGCGSAALCLCA
jgi:hypothetical protein